MSDYAAETDLDKLVAIRTRLDPAAAQSLKSALESHGVPAYVANDHMASLQPGIGADLLVRTGDESRAKSLLKDVHTLPRQPAAAQTVVYDFACTQCGSSYIDPYIGEVPTWLPGLRLEAEAGGGWFKCRSCGSVSRDRPARFQSLPTGLIFGIFMAGLTLSIIWLINWLRWSVL